MHILEYFYFTPVMPRKRHVSRNRYITSRAAMNLVMPRKRHVSRNHDLAFVVYDVIRHASQEACE